MKIFPAIFLLSGLWIGCNTATPFKKDPTHAVYFNGDILTMEGDSAAYAEALVVELGKIGFVGSKAEALRRAGKDARRIDLGGKTLLPGFIDAHGHAGGYGSLAATANLMPPPYGTVMSIPELQEALRKYITEKKIPEGMPVIGNGYDDAIMREHRHPTAAELDAVSTKHPIYIMHTSGHMGVANSLYMQKMGVDYDTPDPVGGTMTRNSREKKLTGRMIENANVNALQTLVKLMPAAAGGDPFAGLLEAEKVWLANGQTTICEGRTGPETVAQIRHAAEQGLLKGDFIVLPDYDANKDRLAQLKPYYRIDTGHFKIGAIKMTFDGSPQGKSAWLTQPYLVPPEGENKDYRGHAIYTRQAAYNGLADIFKHGMVAHIHVNGDAAIDEALTLLDSLQQQGLQPTGAPVVLVHTQLVRKDQVEKIRQLGLMPSWFPTHCYLWGDWYLESVTGLPRAAYISPLADGLRQGIRFTIHHDAPVTPPDLITAIYAAVNRTTRSGKILGADQRISAYEALKAITIHAAYQWGEEKWKGSLLQGKRADLVILDRNPVKAEPSSIRDIHVMATVKDGETVYEKQR